VFGKRSLSLTLEFSFFCRNEEIPWNYDFNYAMRRQMQEIIPGLFLGPNSSASRANKEELLKVGCFVRGVVFVQDAWFT
jgi:hypothetical protein